MTSFVEKHEMIQYMASIDHDRLNYPPGDDPRWSQEFPEVPDEGHVFMRFRRGALKEHEIIYSDWTHPGIIASGLSAMTSEPDDIYSIGDALVRRRLEKGMETLVTNTLPGCGESKMLKTVDDLDEHVKIRKKDFEMADQWFSRFEMEKGRVRVTGA